MMHEHLFWHTNLTKFLSYSFRYLSIFLFNMKVKMKKKMSYPATQNYYQKKIIITCKLYPLQIINIKIEHLLTTENDFHWSYYWKKLTKWELLSIFNSRKQGVERTMKAKVLYLHHSHNTIFICSQNLHHIFTSWPEVSFNTTNFHSFHKHSCQTERNLKKELVR